MNISINSLQKSHFLFFPPFRHVFLVVFSSTIYGRLFDIFRVTINFSLNGDEPISTLTQDFHTRLDNLLRTLVHARPHFVRCIRSNATETPLHLDRGVAMRQIRSLQVLETVNLMAGGYPHRMRFKAFNSRYRLIAPFKQLRRAEEQAVEDTKLILQNAQQTKSKFGASTSWALGKRHIFLSEGIRQQLENLRSETRRKAATAIQVTFSVFFASNIRLFRFFLLWLIFSFFVFFRNFILFPRMFSQLGEAGG